MSGIGLTVRNKISVPKACEMFIRESIPTDKASIVKLLRQIAVASNDVAARTMSDEQHFAIIAKCQTFVIEESDVMVGMISVRMLEDDDEPGSGKNNVAWVMAFGIDENHRGKGFGAELFQYLKRHVTNAGATSIGLSVSPVNVEAAAFYQKMGLIVQSIRMSLDL